MNWTPVLTADGSVTLAHPVHGETCHSRAGAWEESRERYARACRVRERALELGRAGRSHLRLLDVGTGLGLNLAAALEALEGTGVALDAISLEIDRSVIEATLSLGASALADLEHVHAPVRAALASALAIELDARARRVELGPHGDGRLRLLLGDGRATLSALEPNPAFDAVFLDPFSPAVDPALWDPAFLREIARRMAPGSLLSTYSAAVRVRAGLLAAGLRVGPGARVGTKSAGTLAAPDRDLPAFPSRFERRVRSRAALIQGTGSGAT